MDAWNALPEDLQGVVRTACASLYNDVWTEYETKHAQALRQLVETEGVMPKALPEPVVMALGQAAAEVIEELRADEDELVGRITDSFVAYRDLVGGYMTYADNGQMNARAKVLGY